MCDTIWRLDDAKVICRQLGYETAIAALENAAFGEGTGEIWPNGISCQGNENSISECYQWPNSGCLNHGKDVSVICSPPGE